MDNVKQQSLKSLLNVFKRLTESCANTRTGISPLVNAFNWHIAMYYSILEHVLLASQCSKSNLPANLEPTCSRAMKVPAQNSLIAFDGLTKFGVSTKAPVQKSPPKDFRIRRK